MATTKAKTLDEMIVRLPKRQQKDVHKLANQMIAEEMTLRDLRKAMARTQVQLSKQLQIGQDAISRLEARSDMHLSTLARYVEAMGGNLRLVAEFPDRPPVSLQGLADVTPAAPHASSRKTKKKPAATRRKKSTARRKTVAR